MTYYAITNFWETQVSNEAAFDAIYKAMVGDAYKRSDIEEAFEQRGYDPTMTDMSECSYYPVITEQQAKDIEKRFGVKLYRAIVKARPDVSPRLYELTRASPHI